MNSVASECGCVKAKLAKRARRGHATAKLVGSVAAAMGEEEGEGEG